MNPTNKRPPGARGVPQPFNRQAGRATQIKPVVVQPKTGPHAQSLKRPVAPPVYRPQQAPKVLQAKSTLAQSPQAGQTPRRPVAPPVYRPQAKMPDSTRVKNQPNAQPPYRPQPPPKCVQAKSAVAQPPPAPRAYAPHVRPAPVQRKAAPPYAGAAARAGGVVQRAAHGAGERDAESAKLALAYLDARRQTIEVDDEKEAPRPGSRKEALAGKKKTKTVYATLDTSAKDQSIPGARKTMYMIPFAQLPAEVQTQITLIRTTDGLVRTKIRSAYRNESRDLPEVPINDYAFYDDTKEKAYRDYATDFGTDAAGRTPQYIEYTIDCHALGGAARLLYDYYWGRFYVTVTHYNAYLSRYGDDEMRNAFYRVT